MLIQIEEMNYSAVQKLKKQRRHSDQFFKQVDDGLAPALRTHLILLLWAITNGSSSSLPFLYPSLPGFSLRSCSS